MASSLHAFLFQFDQRKKKTKIYNATRGGKLEVFERIDLDELLNK